MYEEVIKYIEKKNIRIHSHILKINVSAEKKLFYCRPTVLTIIFFFFFFFKYLWSKEFFHSVDFQ